MVAGVGIEPTCTAYEAIELTNYSTPRHRYGSYLKMANADRIPILASPPIPIPSIGVKGKRWNTKLKIQISRIVPQQKQQE